MGWEQLGCTDFRFVDFSAGWFPDKNKNDVPGGYYVGGKKNGNPRCGFVDVQHAIWFNGGLRKWFGYTPVNTAQVASGADGGGIAVADWRSELTQCAVFDDKFYENVGGVWTDRTGAVVITPANHWTLKMHIQGSNRFLIGGNGVDPMIKWTGAGNNAAALSGSPLNFHSFDYDGTRWWGVRPDSSYNNIYGSDETNPESNWNASGRVFPFKDTPFGVINNGTWTAIQCRNSIGSIAGFGSGSFQKDEDIIHIGSSAHRTLSRGQIYDPQYGWIDGFYMVAWNGIYFISESKRPYLISESMSERWTSNLGLNKATLHNAVGAWWDRFKLYVCAVPWGSNTYPSQMFVFDARRNACWPMPTILGSSFVRAITVMKDANSAEWLYAQDDNGYVYKFNPDEKNYYPANVKTAIQSHAKSKVFDLGGVYDLREPQLYAEALGDWSVSVYFNFDSESGDGTYGDISLNAGQDVLTTSFVLGASVLGGRTYVNDDIDVEGRGSMFQFMFKNYDADESFNIQELVLWMKFLRKTSLR